MLCGVFFRAELHLGEGVREKVYSPRYNNTAVKTESIKTQSGGVPERHKAHLSWPPIVTKNNNTVTQEAQLSLRDRATRACQLKSGKVLHKCRRLVFEKL